MFDATRNVRVPHRRMRRLHVSRTRAIAQRKAAATIFSCVANAAKP
jgi:hypothetical protein